MSEKIIVPGLSPVTSKQNGNDFDVSVWNRVYKISNAPFFSSILSGGKEVLASPVRVAGTCFGKTIEWEKFENLEMADSTEKSITFVQATKFRELILNTRLTVYYDGMVKCGITLCPEGYHSGAVYGRNVIQEERLSLNKLYLEFPLKKEFAKFYHMNPGGVTTIDGNQVDAKTMSLRTMDYVPEKSLVAPFKQSFYLGNDYAGLSVFFESDEGWRPEFDNKVIECINQEDCILLRVHLLDEEHFDWIDKGGFNGGFLYPINFSFGMQATPVKPMPKNQFVQKAFHSDGILRDGRFDLDIPLPDNKTGEIMVDELKRQGVEYVYVHEKWNDLQNSFKLTKNTAERLKYMVKLCHDRGMKLIPYFGFEIASLSPDFEDFMQYKLQRETHYYDFMHGIYVRTPHQRDLSVCYKSDYSKIFLEGVEKLMDEYGFDGLYLDGTYEINPCHNFRHGCGYIDRNGVSHPTYSVWKKREMCEKLYEIVHSRGGIINIHTSNNFPVPLLAFADSIWDGEVIQPLLLSGTLDCVPEGHYRSVYTGRPLGIFANTISYVNPPVWTLHHSIATMITFGMLPRPQRTSEQLDEVSKIWKIYDEIDVENAIFKPYYENDVKVSNDNVRVTYFENGNNVLAVIANAFKYPSGKTLIEFSDKFKTATDKINDKKVDLINGNTIDVEFETFDYLLIMLSK